MAKKRAPAPNRSAQKRPSPSGRGTPGLLPIAMCLAILAIAIVAVYSGAFDNNFVRWDDPEYVTENPRVLGKQVGPLLKAVVARNYHPMTMLSLTSNVSQPVTPRPFIGTNVFFHFLNSCLILWLAFLILRRRILPALFVALLFAIHPMHVESVAWISERKDVLYSFFFLAATIAYWRYLENRKRIWLVGTFALVALSCLSKGVAVVFPGVMILLDYWKRRRLLDRSVLLEKAPFVALSLLFGLIALDAQGGGDFHGLLIPERVSALGNPGDFTPFQRLAFPSYGHLQYVWKLFVPMHLSAFYSYPPSVEDSYRPVYFVAIAFLLMTIAVLVWSIRRLPIVAFGLGWYLVTLLPVMQWLPVGSAIMADRYTYLPYFGLFVILASGVAYLVEKRPSLRTPVWAVCGLFAAVLMMFTVRQVETWKDTDTLWSNVIRNDPRSYRGYAARGNSRGREGRVAEALSDLRTARLLNPRSSEVYEDLGNAYGSLGQLDSAMVFFSEALRLDPTLGRTYYNRAIAYLRLGRPSEALSDLTQAEALVPALAPSLHFPRGNAYLTLGDDRRAVEEFSRAIEVREGGANAYVNRGLARIRLGDAAGAAGDFQEALRIDPAHAEARARLEALR